MGQAEVHLPGGFAQCPWDKGSGAPPVVQEAPLAHLTWIPLICQLTLQLNTFVIELMDTGATSQVITGGKAQSRFPTLGIVKA